MGTDWSLRAVSPPPGAAEGVQAALDLVVAQMSQWEAASDLSRFNRGEAGVWHEIPFEFAHVSRRRSRSRAPATGHSTPASAI